MDSWLAVVLIVIALFLLRALVFAYLLWRARALCALMKRYWKDELNWAQAGGRKREIVRLFRVAQIHEPGIHHFGSAPSGWMHQTAGAFDILKRGDTQQLIFDAFVEATGYFKDEIRRSVVPIFWPSVVVNLPADLLAYVGIRPEGAAVRIARVVSAVVAFAVSLLAVWTAIT